MKKFEYKEIRRPNIKQLNVLGEDGWEIINVYVEREPYDNGGSDYCYIYLLKRELKDKPKTK